MNDDDLSELILRASAYLDGELDAAEMARAEADPAVMAEVDAMRELQASVRDVEPAPSAARESAIAAALAEFDALNAAHVPVPPADDEPLHLHRPHAPVVPFRPRPSYARWLTAAAAVVAVGVLGVVVLNATSGGDDESGDSTASRIDPSATTFVTGRTAEAEGAAAEESATAEAAEVAPAAADAADAADAAAEAAPATTAAAAAVEESAEASTAESVDVFATGTASPPSFDPERVITSFDELGAVGAELLAGEAQGTIARNVETRCDLTPFEPYQRGIYDDGSGARDVIIAIDPTTLRTAAFDAETCAFVALGPLP